jgi:hypothetical protein
MTTFIQCCAILTSHTLIANSLFALLTQWEHACVLYCRYSLPRWTDLTVSRQGLLDDVWTKPAVMGWMFLPMKPYHAGGDGASFEPCPVLTIP